MGMVLSFLGGASKQLTTDIEQAEQNAREDAKLGFSALYKRYEENSKANRELTSKMDEDKLWVKTNYANATPEQVAALVGNPVALEALKKTDDPYKIDLTNYIKIAQGNESPAVQAERIQALPSLVGKIKESISSKMETPKNRSPLGSLINDFGETSYDSTMGRLAKSQGMSMADLQATSRTQRTNTGATFDMSKLEPPKTLNQQTEKAQVQLVDALRSGDEAKIDAAKTELKYFTKAKAEMSPLQTEFANKIADIKNRYMFGDAETRKAAKPEYDKLMADIRTEAMAKKTGEGAGEGKIPALGTLNTFASASVARAVTAKHGDLIKTKQLAIIEKPDGSVGIDYVGDDQALRRQILETQATAAKNALSLYTDDKGQPLNRDVASVINSFTSAVPSVVRTDGAAATPQPAARPTVPTPTSNLRKEAEAAIAKGADRAAVAKRYKEQTGQEF